MDSKLIINCTQDINKCGGLRKDVHLEVQQNSFHIIPALMSKIQEEDLCDAINWSTYFKSTIFQHAFTCLSAIYSGMQYCQPKVSLDACHTQNFHDHYSRQKQRSGDSLFRIGTY